MFIFLRKIKFSSGKTTYNYKVAGRNDWGSTDNAGAKARRDEIRKLSCFVICYLLVEELKKLE